MSDERIDGATKHAATAHTSARNVPLSLTMSLLRAREAIMRHFRPAFRHFGITEQQWRILRALVIVDTIEIDELAEVTFLLRPSLSRILRDLHDGGLIIRQTSDVDLRRGLVSLSPAGRRLIAEAGAYADVLYGEVVARYGPDKTAALREMLRELEERLEEPLNAISASEFSDRTAKAKRPRGRPRNDAAEE
ncbi:MAG: homoprotocatechuate degradation operon regulator HpaR [Rhizobiaceae bacterium]|nr:homoprotocatechuate degradation operon regulator HpaR [Rhizobiaceae bacterium]